MNKILIGLVCGIVGLLSVRQAECSVSGGRAVMPLDAGWRFYRGDVQGAEKSGFDASAWASVDVPHDWSIAGPFDADAPTRGDGGWLPSGVAWYRKIICPPRGVLGQQVWLEFDGVMANSDVWINGQHLGHRPNGYVSFRYDITDKVKPGADNVLALKCDTSAQPASRWYTGAGIYRHVRMVVVSPVHIEPWGVYVTTPKVDEQHATVLVQSTIRNAGVENDSVSLQTFVEDAEGNIVGNAAKVFQVSGGKIRTAEQAVRVENPQLWDLENPFLYTLVSRVLADGQKVDELRTPFGIRSAEFRSETGFWLNGKNLKLKGVCLHHAAGAVGAAVPLGVWERRLSLLRELGVNAIRTAHNPPAPDFLDLCDRMGFLVMDEFFDCWTKGKRTHDYHKYFKAWAHTDLREGILRDRNHPSVILYSVGNEIHDTPQAELAKGILRGLVDLCHELDPSRPVTQGLFRPNVSHDYDNGLADMLDVIGTNYRDAELLQAWKDNKSRKIINTESGHHRSAWLACRDNAPHAGQFLWVGIDYLGESRSWPLTVFNAGLLDRCGFVMPRGRERQSWWSDKPMVSAFRRIAKTAEIPVDPGYEVIEWKRRQVLFRDWNPHNRNPHEENVEVYSNTEEVELLLNGKSLGRKATRADDGASNWSVPYEPGVLEAVAFNKGKEVARDTLRTAGEPAQLRLVPDRKTVGLSRDDVVHVEVQILDKNGTLVPHAANLVKFSVAEKGELIAVDSGNVVSTESFRASERKAYQGRCLAIFRATGAGSFQLSAQVDGLNQKALTIVAEPDLRENLQ